MSSCTPAKTRVTLKLLISNSVLYFCCDHSQNNELLMYCQNYSGPGHFGATKLAQDISATKSCWSKSALVKIGAGQNRHRSESAQKKNELTLLYLA